MIETRYFRYFLAVAKEGTITKAAKSLYISQSALSKQMAELEKQIGKPLFIRGKRQITLTEEGIYLRNRCQEILELMQTTEDTLKSPNDSLSGEISIGCGETIAMDVFAQVFAEFHQKYPHVLFHINSNDADEEMKRLDMGLIDMALVLGPVQQEKYHYFSVHQKDVFGLLMRKDDSLAKQEKINIDQLKTLPMIVGKRTMINHLQLSWFGLENLPNIVATYNLIHNALYLVERGVGYALCIDRLINTEGRNLVFRPIEPELSMDIYLATRKNCVFSPAAKVFLEMLKKRLESDFEAEK